MRAKDHFNAGVFYLPFDDFHKSTQSPFTHSPTPPFAAKGSGLEQDDGLDLMVAEAAEEVPEATGAETTEDAEGVTGVPDGGAVVPVVAAVVAAGASVVAAVAAVVVVLLAEVLASGS